MSVAHHVRCLLAFTGMALAPIACSPRIAWIPDPAPATAQAQVWVEIGVRRATDTAGPSAEELDTHVALADALIDERRYDEALAHVEAVCEARPALFTCRRLQARALLWGRSDPDGALAASDACIELNADVFGCQFTRGLSLTDLGRPAEAIGALTRAWEISPHSQEVAEPLARAYLAVGEPDGAVAALDAALMERPYEVTLRLLRAAALERAGRLDEAEAAFRALVSLHHQPVEALGHLRLFYQRQGRAEDVARIDREIAGSLQSQRHR